MCTAFITSDKMIETKVLLIDINGNNKPPKFYYLKTLKWLGIVLGFAVLFFGLFSLFWMEFEEECLQQILHLDVDVVPEDQVAIDNALSCGPKCNSVAEDDPQTEFTAECLTDVEDELKFDCYPQADVNKELCLSRGCCWSPVEKQSVPFCYYPVNYGLYSFVNISQLNNSRYNGVEAYMKQLYPSSYPEDVQLLKLVATFETDSRLRVKIFDPLNSRYEVDILPTDEIKENIRPSQNPQYLFTINEEVPGFNVIRKSTQQILFTTVGVGGFIFANQFLQISSLLPSGNVYGLGEHQDSLRHSVNWQRFAIMAHDEIPSKGKNLYGAHPFYLLMENDGFSHGVFLKNSDPMDIILQPAPAITYRVIGGIFDFYFFLGPTPKQVIEQYTEVIGRPAMPPYWGLGFHLCRYNYGSLNRTKEIWSRTREADIPFDVQWNDLDYMDMSNDFTYNKETFYGLPEFVKALHLVGMRYIPIIDPGISNTEGEHKYPPYDQGKDMGIFVRSSTDSEDPFIGKVWNPVSTVWPDFTHPNATEYWTNQLRSFHNQVPFDGAWIDMNEPSNFYSGTAYGCPRDSMWDNPPYVPNVVGGKLYYKTLCMSAGQYRGRHYDLHNVYGLTESIATNFALRQIRGQRPFIISRSTFPGQGHFGGHWSGDISSDWENMRRSITSILNYNMYGIPLVGADICGFNGNTTAPLCQRWMELGAFYPFSRNHNTDDAIDQDPVALGPAVVEASRKALNIRYSLLPYLYTLFWKAHVRGDTVARPLFFEFPHDRLTYDIDTQFLWGSSLLVAPVLTEDTLHVDIYLPRSLWYDFYTQKLISQGGKWQVLFAPLDTIPLLIRGGSILPTQLPNATTTLSRLNPFDLLVALNETGEAEGDLYWDDGDTIDAFELNIYNHIEFMANTSQIHSIVAHWNCFQNDLNVRDVTIMGMNRSVDRITVNGRPHSDFEHIDNVLNIRHLNADLRIPLTIQYF